MNTSEDGSHNDDMRGNVTGIIVCVKRRVDSYIICEFNF